MIDFNKLIKTVRDNLAVNKKFLMKVNAYDIEGNKYKKEVVLKYDTDLNPVISFGWPCEYKYRTLLQNYPYHYDIIIDVGGRNHKGIPKVKIKKEDINRIIEKAKEYLE